MPFKRHLDESFPRVWDRWETDGNTWTIEDLPPGDEDEAIDIMLKHLCPDEPLYILNKLLDDPESVQEMCKTWRLCFKQRISLACYVESGSERTLVALNVCTVKMKGDRTNTEVRGENYKNAQQTRLYLESKLDILEHLNVDKALIAMGLVVRKEYRGARLGSRLLAAREPLCRYLGIKATVSTFTSIIAQKVAVRSGFTTILEVSIKELSEAGLKYPKEDNRIIKIMMKKYE
ncbi:uncharacterized protein LOC113523083 [Galleria mellonella]|uniref:Uncharacterized protein LOC113523083 n=1 Tax=Galleria mellonella TaxID=7137 RepID=A0A6J1X4M5_GALME|nr:uncharacterized protein LOC113523083 [Galleria mellonella]XP_052753811.1 uncharacterized protein LOC113523083 [Galleria mellonella]